MVTTHDEAVQLFNDAILTADHAEKVGAIGVTNRLASFRMCNKLAAAD